MPHSIEVKAHIDKSRRNSPKDQTGSPMDWPDGVYFSTNELGRYIIKRADRSSLSQQYQVSGLQSEGCSTTKLIAGIRV